ncbi:Core-2/I-branching beta-1,6-N-acetylglucosaminyltransferase family protein [Striga asiatica]|uniref:Core-2/I-branching beta-1,6-N-acetylglucosaminyltransferase family protein n=1 Tax=Striga asiatica TaxID=4170 RepID=A0A5A7QDG5_STRAF|nr:Core-2/I-branching beta-1,6-N-acetylglucosaminyltransferase family protein [Striga asiatica]
MEKDAWSQFAATGTGTRSTAIRNPVIRYVQRMMVYLYTGQSSNKNIVDSDMIWRIWGMLHGHAMCSDDHYVETLLAVGARNDEIALGGLITCFAEHAGVELRGRVPIGRVSTLDTSLLGPGQLNLLFKDNDYFWRVAQGELIALPNPEYTKIRVNRNIKMDHPTMPQVAVQLPDSPSPSHGISSSVEDQLRRRVEELEEENRSTNYYHLISMSSSPNNSRTIITTKKDTLLLLLT